MEANLRKDSFGVSHVVFFVVAAVAPLTAVVGATPAAFTLKRPRAFGSRQLTSSFPLGPCVRDLRDRCRKVSLSPCLRLQRYV
jgi:hypothetical protein